MSLLARYREWRRLRQVELELRTFAVGMNSTVDLINDLHIVMLDYDIKDLRRVKESIDELQGFWGLSDAFIFKTKNGHHVFFFYDIVPYGRLKLIIEYARYVDPMFKFISRMYDHKTIRVAGKYKERDIEFAEVVRGPREPTKEEFEIGELKRLEHAALSGCEYEVRA